MRNKNRNYNLGKCLENLYDLKGIDVSRRGWAENVAIELFEEKILKYRSVGDLPEDAERRKKQRHSTAKILLDHIKLQSACELSGKWIMYYCDYFGCDADYLCGYSLEPSHKTASAAEVTGLSRDAINALRRIKKSSKNNQYAKRELATINFLLSTMYKQQRRLRSGYTDSIFSDLGLFISSGELEKENIDVRIKTEKNLETLKTGDVINGAAAKNIYLQCKNSRLNVNDEKVSLINRTTNEIYQPDSKKLLKAMALETLHEKLLKLECTYQNMIHNTDVES